MASVVRTAKPVVAATGTLVLQLVCSRTESFGQRRSATESLIVIIIIPGGWSKTGRTGGAFWEPTRPPETLLDLWLDIFRLPDLFVLGRTGGHPPPAGMRTVSFNDTESAATRITVRRYSVFEDGLMG